MRSLERKKVVSKFEGNYNNTPKIKVNMLVAK